MSIYSQEEVEERFRRLPEPLKEQMMSAENSERIFEVGKKFGLTVEQIGFLAEESGYVVLGLTHPNDFVPRVKDHLRVDEQKAKSIAQEINHQVFFPLREMLKNTHQFELTQDKIQQQSSPTPSVPRTQPPPPKFPPVSEDEAPSSTMSSVSHITSVPFPPTPLVPPQSSTGSITSKPPIAPSQPVITPNPPSVPQTPLRSGDISGVNPRMGIPMTIAPSQPPVPTVPPSPTIAHPVPPPLNPLTPSAIQEKKPDSAIPSIMPAPLKSVEGIKLKEPDAASPRTPLDPSGSTLTSSPQASIAPSQMMQKKFLEENKKIKPPMQSQVERMKESLFAPASTPIQPKSETVPTPQSQNPAPSTEIPSKPASPSYSSGSDPYREPLE